MNILHGIIFISKIWVSIAVFWTLGHLFYVHIHCTEFGYTSPPYTTYLCADREGGCEAFLLEVQNFVLVLALFEITEEMSLTNFRKQWEISKRSNLMFSVVTMQYVSSTGFTGWACWLLDNVYVIWQWSLQDHLRCENNINVWIRPRTHSKFICTVFSLVSHSAINYMPFAGASSGAIDLLPSPSATTNWTAGLLMDNNDMIFKFDGKQGAKIPDGIVPKNLTDQFTISLWMKHGPSPGLRAEKETILCNSDKTGESYWGNIWRKA